MKLKNTLKSVSIFTVILVLFSSTIIYISSQMIEKTLKSSDEERLTNTIESLAPMVKTSIKFNLESFLSENLTEVVNSNKYINKLIVRDSQGNIISQSNNDIDISNAIYISSKFDAFNNDILIEAYPSNILVSETFKNYEEMLYSLIMSIPFLILIAIFLYSSIIVLHNKEKEKAYEELKQQMEDEITNHQKKTNMMFHQSRLASMGEMISNIAHQWRQPLNTVSLVLQNLKLGYSLNNLDKDKFEKSMNQIENSLLYMSETITTFRNFYKSNTETEIFTCEDVVKESIAVIGSSLEDNKIQINTDIKINEEIDGYKNELTQVIVNILSNAKDILLKRNIANAVVNIKTFKPSDEKGDKKVVISIEDNGNGIPEDVLPQIFDPYFTTKHKDQGTGLGLYMSNIIIKEKFKGDIKAINTKDGARFDIELNIHKK